MAAERPPARRAVRLRAERGALADGGGAVAALFGKSVYVGSAGVQKGEVDPFAVAAMEEIGIDIARHKPITFEELEDLEGLNFDLIVTLSPPAHHKALGSHAHHARRRRILADRRPDRGGRHREQRLNAYREVRDQLLEHIRARFGRSAGGNE